MEEKRTPATRTEVACWIVGGAALYGALLAWAAGVTPLMIVLITVATTAVTILALQDTE